MGNVDKSSSLSAENPSPLAGRNWLEKMLVSFIAKHTPTCREVARLQSQSMEAKLPLATRIKIQFHYLICVWCYRYGEQLRALRKIAASLPEHLDECGREALPYSSLDRSWNLINNKPGGNADQKQIRVGLQVKLALLGLVRDYSREREIAAGIVDLAKSSFDLSKFASEQLEIFLISSPRTALRLTARLAIQSLNEGHSLPPVADGQHKGISPVLIVAPEQMQGEGLAQLLRENGIDTQGVDVISAAKDAKLVAPEMLEIRFSKRVGDEAVLTGLAEKVKRLTGEEPKLVDDATNGDPGSTRFGLPSAEKLSFAMI